MAPKRSEPAAKDNLALARLIKSKTYNPPYEYAHKAFHNLSEADKLRALRGADERNFKDYDIIQLQNPALRMPKAPDVRGATEKEIKSDLVNMGIISSAHTEGREAGGASARAVGAGAKKSTKSAKGKQPVKSSPIITYPNLKKRDVLPGNDEERREDVK